jgi:hypothetical protein
LRCLAVALEDPASGLLHARAHQAEGKLSGQQFVIGEPAARRVLQVDILGVARCVQAFECIVERGEALASHDMWVDPFIEVGDPAERGFDRPPQHFRRYARRQRINGFDQRQFVGLVRGDHVVGMNHGRATVEPFNPAAHKNLLADRQGLVEPAGLGVEEDEADFASLVMREYPVGHIAASARRRLVAVDAQIERDNRAFRRMRDARAVAPVDDRMRQVKDQAEDSRFVDALGNRDQVAQQHRDARADTVQRTDGSKERIEDGRAHAPSLIAGLARSRLTSAAVDIISATILMPQRPNP